MTDALFSAGLSMPKTTVALLAVAAIAAQDLLARGHHRHEHTVFAVLLGTLLSLGLIKCIELLLAPAAWGNAPLLGLGIVLVVLAWRLLFGPWDARVKATVLGTFLFWVAFRTLAHETSQERVAHLIAIAIAAVPALVWCALFQPYHRERRGIALLMFFSGMASTAPILFYDMLTRRKAELDFFVVRIVPQNFSAAVQDFIRQVGGDGSVPWTLVTLFVTFLFVGLLEEGSKYWVLRRNGQRFFTSIDDALQLAILVAIGFAFAENITSTGYFFTFVREFLGSGKPDWAGFLGNIAGRSILTSMVHIVSTGVLGYFVGLAIFAGPRLREAEMEGKRYWFAEYVHRLLGLDRTAVYRTEMLIIGIVLATVLHGLSNFLVTLPDVLPGKPRTFGELFGAPSDSVFHYVALLLVPALLYVVGGFWLLTALFDRKENMKERGHLIRTESFVAD